MSLVLVVGTPSLASAQESQGCNEWAGYHQHSFGCHAHPDDPHPPAAEPAMMDMDMDMTMDMGMDMDMDMAMDKDMGMDMAMAMAPPVPVHGIEGCNEWASYHWHSFGCHAHPDDPHPPAAEPAMMDMDMDMTMDMGMDMASDAPMSSSQCNEWAGYHEHSFGCHAHPGTPHASAE
ncbi:MAG: hypothetical protein OXH72_02160 [Caldilineaceae bacterium]|nr:hypothetical protein [Caldilineaceae bacterium]